ncbi:MAG: hypothetical protein LAT55_13585 [Opitutales bacterium]|nr:hypothetical protein [Opitutales bacterium]
MKVLSLFLFLTTGSLLLAEQSPWISFSTPVVPLKEDVSVFVYSGKSNQNGGSLELHLTTLTGRGGALFAEDKQRLSIDENQFVIFSGFEASSQINNIALSLYYEEERIDTVLLTVVNPELIRFEEAIAATEKYMQAQEDRDWRIPHHLPSAYLQEDENRFVITYPNNFSNYSEGNVRFGDQTFRTFLVDAKTGEVTDVLGGSMIKSPKERLE